ncbi:MAG: peroxiredoxin family protein [Mucilaginibacter sp.]
MKQIFRVMAILIFFHARVHAQAPAAHIPPFTFYRLDGKPLTQKDISKGKKDFFVFFDSSCEHCQHALHDIGIHYNRFKKTDVYLVTLDNRETINNFMDRYGAGIADKPNVHILQDRQNEFISTFKPRKYPSMLLYSSNGDLIRYEDNEHYISKIYDQL